MRNKKYVKQPYHSDAEVLQKSVDVMQNLPAHAVASARNSLTRSVNIDKVMDRCLDRLETIKLIEDSVERRMEQPTYRSPKLPQWPPARDLAEAARIGHEVLLWLQNWDSPLSSKDMSVDHEFYVHRDGRLTSCHDVCYEYRMGHWWRCQSWPHTRHRHQG